MAFRRTKGIVSDSDWSDPKKEADVIMTAAALGFAASYVKTAPPYGSISIPNTPKTLQGSRR